MKKYFTFLFLFPIILSASIGNFQFDRNIVKGSEISGTILCHNNKLYTRNMGTVNSYNILPDGDLVQECSIRNYLGSGTAFPFIIGDSLYTSDVWFQINVLGKSEGHFKCFNISGESIEYADSISIDNLCNNYNIKGSDNYIFLYLEGSNPTTKIYNRHNFEYITSTYTGMFFSIKDTLLLVGTHQGNNLNLSIKSINDINNIYEISNINIGEYQICPVFYFDNDILYLTRQTDIIIIDLSNPHIPVILSKIENIPQLSGSSVILSIVKWGEYLLFAENGNKIWVYDVDNPSNPIFLNCFSDDRFIWNRENGLAKSDNYIYYAGNKYDIFKIEPQSLPDINVSKVFNIGMHYFSSDYNIIDNNLLIYDYYEEDNSRILIYDINSQSEPFPLTGIGDYNSLISLRADSLFIGYNNQSYLQKISIFKYQNNQFIKEDSLSFNSPYNYYLYGYKNKNLAINNEHGSLRFYRITDDYSLEYLNSFNYSGNLYQIKQTSFFTLNYFYGLSIDESGNHNLSIIENEYPFTEIYNVPIIVNGHHENSIFLLSNDKIMSYYISPSSNLITYKLCNYVFPDSFELLDTKVTDQAFFIHDNYLLGIKNGISEVVHYYTWINNSIEEVYSFDFGYPVYDNIFLPEQNKLITVGAFEINIYDCDYSSVENNEITNIYPIKIYNYPNPFNPTTTISFNSEKRIKNTQIAIYNLKGQKIRDISVENCKAGTNKVVWDGKDNNGKKVASGVYLYSLKQNGKTKATKKMIMLK